ncbi:MAG: cupin domain-containing protein [Gammaproteobacteria bacterium]|nr:cupin domain-containing protein [Gammaproteobacteria bacterium]
MNRALPLLGGLTPEQFLRQYWQKRPLLIRAAVADFKNPLSADELAGLACEESVESRLILEEGGDQPWQLLNGPFEEYALSQLPQTHWTLLVQEVHKYVPELAQLLDAFRFIPSWRIDDIMVSCSPPQGSVGPHVDQYDVFLLQGEGQKKWYISEQSVAESDLIEGIDLRILKTFTAEQEWLLNPGDMLYLPPGIIHHGVAVDHSLTYSVGFRAPSSSELVGSYLENRIMALDNPPRYSDPELKLQQHTGAISLAARRKVRALIRSMVVDDEVIDRWFGSFVTENRGEDGAFPRQTTLSEAQFVDMFFREKQFWRSEYSRFSYMPSEQGLTLFVAGECYDVNANLHDAIALLCDQRRHTFDAWSRHLEQSDCCALLCRLCNEGHLEFSDDSEDGGG